MLDFKNLVDGVNLDRDTIFTSLSSKDKDVALRLVKRLGQLKLKHWCMYHENGLDRNISGDKYPETISGAISHCCIFIYLMSENSLKSSEVLKEIMQISPAVKAGEARVLPIFVDGTENSAIPEKITELLGVDPTTIIRRYDEKSSERELDSICDEIVENYVTVVFDKVRKKFEKQENAQLFIDLMNSCVRNTCDTNSISEDIKNSTEVSTDSVKEIHVLSNELCEYDCNVYSCMIIASNLLGNEELVGTTKRFRPDKRGLKYFYYIPSGYEVECATAFDKVKDFVRKTEESRRQVTSLIRGEFSARNKVVTFFKEFNGKTIADLKEQYSIEEKKDVERFDKLFESETAQSYFAYSDSEDVFSVPDEFIAWISGDNTKFDYNTMIDCTYEFIEFMGKFVDLLDEAEDINSISLEILKKRYLYLERFRELEDWQMRKIPELSAAKAKRLVNYLLDYTADANAKSTKKFPRLASWMQFYHNEDGEVCDIEEATIQKAFDNLICVPIDENEALKLCYSYVVFVGHGNVDCAWYTTGVGSSGDGEIEDMVTTYNFGKQEKEYDMLLKAWTYMLKINPDARGQLVKNKSEFLKLLQKLDGGIHK